MKITLLVFGKTDASYIQEGVQEFVKRISFFCPAEVKVIAEPKNHGKLSPANQMEAEAHLFTAQLLPQDMVVLLDEKVKPIRLLPLQSNWNNGLIQAKRTSCLLLAALME